MSFSCAVAYIIFFVIYFQYHYYFIYRVDDVKNTKLIHHVHFIKLSFNFKPFKFELVGW